MARPIIGGTDPPTRARETYAARESLLAGGVVGPALASVVIAQEARQLGRDRVTRGKALLLFFELVGLLLEGLDVRLRLRVRHDRVGDVLDVLAPGLRKLGDIELVAEQLAEPAAERLGGPRARRQRDI